MPPALLAFAAFTAAASPAAPPPPGHGAALYARYCALCHGADREGHAADHAPSLRTANLLAEAPPAFLWMAVSYGRPGTAMAAFSVDQGGPLSHDDQHAILEWLTEQAGVTAARLPDAPVPGDAARGAGVYAAACASCHGARGEGGSGTALANPVTLATATDAWLRRTVAAGRPGTPMPGFEGRLSPAELDDVVAFLRSRALGWDAPPPVKVRPPDPAKAVVNPGGPPARLEHREGRFVSGASVAAALQRGERMVLLDARPTSDWARAHLPGALPLPYYDGVEPLISALPRDGTPIVAYCACPHAASGKVVDALQAQGFVQARILDEGVLHWAAQGWPMELGIAP